MLVLSLGGDENVLTDSGDSCTTLAFLKATELYTIKRWMFSYMKELNKTITKKNQKALTPFSVQLRLEWVLCCAYWWHGHTLSPNSFLWNEPKLWNLTVWELNLGLPLPQLWDLQYVNAWTPVRSYQTGKHHLPIRWGDWESANHHHAETQGNKAEN